METLLKELKEGMMTISHKGEIIERKYLKKRIKVNGFEKYSKQLKKSH